MVRELCARDFPAFKEWVERLMRENDIHARHKLRCRLEKWTFIPLLLQEPVATSERFGFCKTLVIHMVEIRQGSG